MTNGDLRVNEDLLSETRDSIARVAREFEGSTARRDATAAIWGSPQVAGAMSEFHDNWTRHRRLLVEQLRQLGEYTEGVIETFEQVERDLADAFTPDTPTFAPAADLRATPGVTAPNPTGPFAPTSTGGGR